ncbi:MAG TPA: high-affinity nickel-transport family protein [Polyangiaceae bacterium]|nr:high-affinity nickel-transport family protein [Polyangiaceae bacterium]
MSGVLSILVLGFLLGVRHATDVDHVVAVSALTSRGRSIGQALKIGLAWGVGHALTVLMVGGAIVLLELRVPARLGLGLEFTVAAVLIVLGALNLSTAARELRTHRAAVPSVAGAVRPFTAAIGLGLHGFELVERVDGTHVGDPTRIDPHGSSEHTASRTTLGSLGVGLAHGLAGSAAIALLVVSSLEQSNLALVYLAVFGVGTILGMSILTLLMALPVAYATQRLGLRTANFACFAGILSLTLGLVLVYQIGFVHGLFTGNPSWHPG